MAYLPRICFCLPVASAFPLLLKHEGHRCISVGVLRARALLHSLPGRSPAVARWQRCESLSGRCGYRRRTPGSIRPVFALLHMCLLRERGDQRDRRRPARKCCFSADTTGRFLLPPNSVHRRHGRDLATAAGKGIIRAPTGNLSDKSFACCMQASGVTRYIHSF